MAAAMASRTANKIGFVGGMDIPLITSSRSATEGRAVNPRIEVFQNMTGDARRVNAIRRRAPSSPPRNQFQPRCRRDLPAAGATGVGVIQTAKRCR